MTKKIALISPGSLGAAVGKALSGTGHYVLCDVSSRSAATKRRAFEEGFLLCRSLNEMLLECDVILSLATPSQALLVSKKIYEGIKQLQEEGVLGVDHKKIFVDGNSISPETAGKVFKEITYAGMSGVKASFFGPADTFAQDNVLVLSGVRGAEVASLFEGLAEVRLISKEFCAAAAVKMSMSIFTKCLPAVFLESMGAAVASGQLDATLKLFERLYPGHAQLMKRVLPTYPRHVLRRADEMLEIEAWLCQLGQEAAMTRSARESLDALRLYKHSGEDLRDLQQVVQTFIPSQPKAAE